MESTIKKAKVHYFDSTGEAYDATQIGDAPWMDILVVPSEKVVGLSCTWPLSVTDAHGELHKLRDSSPIGWADYLSERAEEHAYWHRMSTSECKKKAYKALEEAKLIANEKEWSLY